MTPSSHNRRLIKVCGITTEEDGLAAAEMGVSAIGLNFYSRSPRYVSSNQALKIAEALPASVLRVGVFVNPSADELSRVAHEFRLDVIQIHGALPANLPRLRIWKAVGVDASLSSSDLEAPGVEAFLLDAPAESYGGSGRTFDWSLVSGVGVRFVLAGGLDASNVEEAISIAKPWGVDACSKVESAPARKDWRKMRDFVRAAERGFLSLENVAELLR
ncbi:MAG: phosphoribosylanthranilate isomerase [Bryobacteraceae bacterium]